MKNFCAELTGALQFLNARSDNRNSKLNWELFLLQKFPDRLLCSPSLLFRGYRGLFLQGKRRTWCINSPLRLKPILGKNGAVNSTPHIRLHDVDMVIYIYIYRYVCMYVYVYIYIRIYIHTHTHTHIYIHI